MIESGHRPPGDLAMTWLIAWRAAVEALHDRLTLLMSVFFAIVLPFVLLVLAIVPLAADSEAKLGGSGRSCRYQAHIIGTASFMSSEGWKRMNPRFNQRCAPKPI